MKRISITLILSIAALMLYGQIPNAFNYQGVLRGTDGEPMANEELEIRISIDQDSFFLNSPFREIHNIRTSDLGVFNIYVGYGTPEVGRLSDIDWSLGFYFLQVEEDLDDDDNFIRLGYRPLVSVPYALYAGNGTDELWKEGNDEIFHDEKNVRIGEQAVGSIDGVLTVVGYDGIFSLNSGQQVRSVSRFLDVPENGGGLRVLVSDENDKSLFLKSARNNSNLSFVTRTNMVDYERMTIDNDGLVGIGTNNPLSQLHVMSDIAIQNTDDTEIMFPIKVYDTFNNRRFTLRHSYDFGTSITDFDVFTLGNTANTRIRFNRQTFTSGLVAVDFMRGNNSSNVSARIASNGADSFFQNHGGNFGIGVQEPKSKLHVTDGDVFIEDIQKGVIMKSPNGSCWRMTISNNGSPVTTQITCPN